MKTIVTAAIAASVILGASIGHAQVPTPDHVLILVLENHDFESIIGSDEAPYINSLVPQGALFSDSHGVTHPSQPNYLWLFSGDDQGVTSDACPNTFSTENLGNLLLTSSLGFAGYSEDLPAEGSTVCNSGQYARKHNPWVNFTNVPTSANKPFTAFPSDYSTLPTVSFVIPNQFNDMHSAPIGVGDTWLMQHIDGFVNWALSNNSLFILTFDEDDFSPQNHIPTLFIGSMVEPGSYAETIDHVDVLRTIEDMYGLAYAGASDIATPITDVWSSCGDGVADVGEECGEPTLTCGAGETCRACTCVNATICQSGITFAKPKLTMAANPFVMKLKAEAVVPKPWVGVDPVANGIQIQVDELEGAGGIDAVLSGGALWRVNGTGTKWSYTDPLGTVAGITKAIVSDQSKHQDGLLKVVVKGKGGVATLPDPAETRMAVVLGAANECAAVRFDGVLASCSGDSVKIKCK